jgi:hypothetical protein
MYDASSLTKATAAVMVSELDGKHKFQTTISDGSLKSQFSLLTKKYKEMIASLVEETQVQFYSADCMVIKQGDRRNFFDEENTENNSEDASMFLVLSGRCQVFIHKYNDVEG